MERLRHATCRLQRLEEEEAFSRAAIRAVPATLRAEIRQAETQLAGLTSAELNLPFGAGRSGIFVDDKPAGAGGRTLLCSNSLSALGADTDDAAAGLAQLLYKSIRDKRAQLQVWERLAALERCVPAHATLTQMARGGTYWAVLGFGYLEGTWALDDWLRKVLRAPAAVPPAASAAVPPAAPQPAPSQAAAAAPPPPLPRCLLMPKSSFPQRRRATSTTGLETSTTPLHRPGRARTFLTSRMSSLTRR